MTCGPDSAAPGKRRRRSCQPGCIHTRALVALLQKGYIEARTDEDGEVRLYTTPRGEATMEEPGT